jgi:hypothetical protein
VEVEEINLNNQVVYLAVQVAVVLEILLAD